MTATTSATLTDGREARLRPLRRSDRERIVAAFDRLSEESRYRRFFAPLHQLSDRSLELLAEIGPTSRSLEGNLVELDIELPEERLGAALGAALRAAAGSIFGVRPLSERLLRAAHELWEARRPRA